MGLKNVEFLTEICFLYYCYYCP